MLVVHALWSPGRGVLLWAEDGERPATGRSRALRTARPHPFAVPAAALATLHPGTPTQVTLLLPAHSGGPLASPELVRSAPGPAPRGTPELRAWAVPAVAVDPAELDDPAEELRYGASVAHVRAVVAFADDLARRGHVLPTLERAGSAARARWRPVVQGIDQAAVEALVATMPPVARAEPAGTANLPADPAALVADALDVLVDGAVRDRLARAGVAHRGGQGAVDAWLTALTSPDDRLPARAALGPLAEALAGVGRRRHRAARRRPRVFPARRGPGPVRGTGRHRRRHALAAGVPPAVQQRPQPARRRDAGVGRCGGPADRRPAGGAARRARPGRPRLPAARRRAPDRPPRRARPEPGGRPPRARRRRRAARRRRVRGAAARRLGRRPPGRAAAVRPQHARAGRRRARRAGPRAGRCLPLVAGRRRRRRRRSRRGGDRRPRRREGPAGAAARGLGERGPGRAAPRPRVPPPRRPPAADGRRRARARRGRPGRRPAAAADRHRRGRVARRPARRHRGPDADPGRAARHVHRAAAALPAARRRLAGVPLLARAGRLPGRRHGPGQDRPAARARVRRPRRDAAGPDTAALPHVDGRHVGARGRPLRPGPAGARPPRPRPASRRRPARGPRGHRPAGHHLRDRRTRRRRPRRGRLAPARARRGPGGEERPLAAGPRRPPVPGPAPRRAHRHPGGEPPRRALGDHGRAQPGHPRHRRAVPDALRHPRRAAREHRRRGAAAPHHPPLPAAAGQDRSDDRGRPPRQDRDHPALPADPRAGLALPHDRRRHAGEDRRLHRHRPARQRAGGDDQAQAGLQPPGAAAARRLADRPPLRQGRAAGGDPRRGPRGGRPRPVLHPVRRVRAPARPAPVGPARHGDRVPARRRPAAAARGDRPALPGRRRARRSCWPR